MKRRLEIYKQMLEDFSLTTHYERTSKKSDWGFCYWLYRNNQDKIEYFPELMAQKPVRNWLFDPSYWWSLNVKQQTSRVKALRRAITLCEQKLKYKNNEKI